MESIHDIPRFQTHPIPYTYTYTLSPQKMIGFIPYKMVQNWEGYPQNSLQQNQELLVGTRCPPHSEGFLPPGSPCAPPTSTPQSAHPSDVSPKKGDGAPNLSPDSKMCQLFNGKQLACMFQSLDSNDPSGIKLAASILSCTAAVCKNGA